MATTTVMKLMGLSISAAKRAGGIIRDIMKSGQLDIVEKEGKDDLQTEADRSAQRCIIASVSKQFPNIKIIGEEGNAHTSNVPDDMLVTEVDVEFITKNSCPDYLKDIKEEDLVVWVDPLDGTSEYTQGFLEHVTVLIGIAFQSSAVGGVIHQPYYQNANGEIGRTIWGLKGLGVDGFNSKKLDSSKFIVTTTRSHFNNLVKNALDAINPTEVIRVGGAGFKVLQLLEGKAHAYVFASAGCKKWDTCAPEAILEAHGGVLTDISGEHYQYNADVEFPNKNGVLATAPDVSHQLLVDQIPKEVKESMSNK
ncbi:3'(2'),5'-bisphosphate nucleotidase 1 [Condylostylus longicornis]|uniref:3'(2'),5'-bisphosphate nucleotidase 1 n=1 Tax=Condylostylus longicornis TaxID=2530218 RepID=UPI00244E4710|nr:3'(2'),5'-bisphosphate nucleotidase 1 [Condylostylus longicornis]